MHQKESKLMKNLSRKWSDNCIQVIDSRADSRGKWEYLYVQVYFLCIEIGRVDLTTTTSLILGGEWW